MGPHIKRSTAITLILVGTGVAAVAAAAYPRQCHDAQGQPVSCGTSRSSSRISFGNTSSRSHSATPTRTTTSRGGFGSSGVRFSGGG